MIYAIILAGGTGSRFWPFSRELEPKQFIKLIDNRSLLQNTIRRIENFIQPENIYIVTNKNYLYDLRKQIENFAIPSGNIILEPVGKNTAPAIGLCAVLIAKSDPDATLIILPSDHYIKGKIKFIYCLKKAISCAKNNFLVTIGIKPEKPATGYGYIKIGNRKKGYFLVDKFLEKPDQNRAKKYLNDRRFFWNSGIFVGKASTFLEEFKKNLPQLYSNLIIIESKDDIEKVWHKVKPISVDCGIMEHSKKIALIPADFYWTDLGSWDALNTLLPKDKNNNVIQADCLNLDSSSISVFGRGNRLIATVGIKDLVIADTPDAVLICNKDRTQDVKNIVEYLKANRRKEHVAHTSEKRPWGSFTILKSGIDFKIKLIEIEPKKRLSLQRHAKRTEHWVVVSGRAKVTSGKKTKFVHRNKSIYIPMGIKHRLENPGNSPLRIVEVQTGNYLEEDDIQRFKDDFARK